MQRVNQRLKQNNRQGQRDVPGISFSRLALLLVGFSLLLGLWVGPAAGQAAATLEVSALQTGAFPEISIEFKLTDSTGYPIRNLETSQLTVIENEQERSVSDVSEDYRGIHFILVINGDREMDLRDASGISRYQKLSDSLHAWASGWHFSGDDSWSIMTNTGLEVDSALDAVTWMTGLDTYQPNFRQLESMLLGLQEAVQMLRKAEVPFGVDKALLIITPPPTSEQIDGVNALAEQARQAGIQVNVWMVGEAYYLTNDQGGSLIEMAATTGGQFFNYTGSETIPDLNGSFNDLGYAGELTYESGITSTGTYPLAIRAEISGLEVIGESQPFYVEVLPPNPILLAPPVSIIREAVVSEDSDEVSFTPSQIELQIMVEFPDDHPRALAVSRLLVDGSVVHVNAAAPFDVFSWDISKLTESGEHTIQVEVEDSLGFEAATLLTPVRIEVQGPGLGEKLSFQTIILIVSGVVAGGGLVLLGGWGFRKFWRAKQPHLQNRRQAAGSKEVGNTLIDEIGDEQPFAHFIPLDEFDEPGLAISKARVLIGSDPEQADIIISDPSIEPIQAELVRDEDGFWLRYFGSFKKTTWLNYRPVGSDRVRVQPGDLLHFGERGFRFTMEDDETDQKIVVERYEPFS